ncbi:recombinase family protein [Roseomonas sp. WA12]
MIGEHQDVASCKDDRWPGFQAALTRCRQLGAVLVAAHFDRITPRAYRLSWLLEGGMSLRATAMRGADDLMMRVNAAIAQKERRLTPERTRAALSAVGARGAMLGGVREDGCVPGPQSRVMFNSCTFRFQKALSSRISVAKAARGGWSVCSQRLRILHCWGNAAQRCYLVH